MNKIPHHLQLYKKNFLHELSKAKQSQYYSVQWAVLMVANRALFSNFQIILQIFIQLKKNGGLFLKALNATTPHFL